MCRRRAEQADAAGDLLETIQDAGVIRISTDANYEPQSFRDPDGNWVGFDIDVGTAIAEGLGVEAEFQHLRDSGFQCEMEVGEEWGFPFRVAGYFRSKTGIRIEILHRSIEERLGRKPKAKQ